MRSAIAVLLALLWAENAAAGVVFVVESHELARPDSESSRARVSIEYGRLRIEELSSAGSRRAVVFRSDPGLVWLLDLEARTYRQIDREALLLLRQRTETRRRSLNERLARLEPARRDAFSRMMRSHAPLLAPPLPARALVPGEQSDRVDGKSCRLFRIQRAGEGVEDVCVVRFGALGLRQTQLSVFRDLGDFYRELSEIVSVPTLLGLPDEPFELFDQLPGFPLRIRHIRAGVAVRETHFRGVRSEKLKASLFELPADARLQPLSVLGGPASAATNGS